jgi:trehalose 6-phosphate synthase/phosphatase
LLLLDYDGTLVPFSNRPQDAIPDADLVRVLASLSELPSTKVVVVSGRSSADLEDWFRGAPGIWLASEHGAALKPPHSTGWQLFLGRSSCEQRQRVLAVLEGFVDRTPGSFIEEKEFSVVWHYRMSDPEFGEWLANELVSNLELMLADTELRAVHGNKTVEVRPVWANKGQVRERLTNGSDPDFILAAGDDRTDEDLFAELPSSSWTIHVGPSRSRARYRLSSPSAMVSLVRDLLGAWPMNGCDRRQSSGARS